MRDSTVVFWRYWFIGHGASPAEASWFTMEEFKKSYPNFQQEDELLHQVGGSVTGAFWGQTYRRRSKAAVEVVDRDS